MNNTKKKLIIFASDGQKRQGESCTVKFCLFHHDKALAHVRGTADTIKRLVTDLEKHTLLSGRNISYDRL